MSALFQLGEILKYWESPNQIYNTTIRIWHRFGLPQKYRYIYIYNCLDWRTEVSKSYLDSVVESDVARRRQQTYCVYFKKAGTLKPNFNAFCYERISIFQQQKYPHNVRIWLVQWWWDQENMMFKKVSAGVHNCKKKNTLLNIVHQSNLRTKIASKKLLLSSSTWWFVITPTFLIFTQIFRGSFSSPSPPNPPNTPRKPAVSDDALLYLLLDVWLPTSWWHHLAGQRVRDVGEGGRRAAVLQWIECLSWQSSFTGVRGLDVPMQKLDV